MLCLPHSLCRPLSDVVHSKTGGVILFILRFLASLDNDGDLWFSMTKRRWMYDLEQIRQKEIHNDVVTHMTEVLLHLQFNRVARSHHRTDLPFRYFFTAHEKLIQENANGVEGGSMFRNYL